MGAVFFIECPKMARVNSDISYNLYITFWVSNENKDLYSNPIHFKKQYVCNLNGLNQERYITS